MDSKKLSKHVLRKVIAVALTLFMCLGLLPGNLFVKEALAEGEVISVGIADGGSIVEDAVITDWSMDAGGAKTLNISLSGLVRETGNYKIKVELAKGMRFETYLWNSDATIWGGTGTLSPGKGIRGSAEPMKDLTQYIVGNKLEKDANGTTTLTYDISEDMSGVSLNRLSVIPDYIYAYNGDKIGTIDNYLNLTDPIPAVRISVVNPSGTVIAEKSYDVTVKTSGIQLGRSYYAYYPGDENKMLCRLSAKGYFNGSDDFCAPAAELDYIFVPLHQDIKNVIKDIKKVTISNLVSSKNLSYVYDEENAVILIKGIGKVKEGYAFSISIYGDILETAAKGTYQGNKARTWTYDDVTYNSVKGEIVFSWNTYDGKKYVTSGNAIDDGNQSSILRHNHASAVAVKSSNGHINVSGISTKALDGQHVYAGAVSMGNSARFSAGEELTEDQIVTWRFNPDSLDIEGVFFPVEGEKITVTHIKFNDGTEYNINLDVAQYKNEKHAFVTVPMIKSALSALAIPESAKYISSITANCGKFSNGYKSDMENVWLGFPVGYVNPLQDTGVNHSIPYYFEVAYGEQTYSQTFYAAYRKAGGGQFYTDIYVKDQRTDEYKTGNTTIPIQAGQELDLRMDIGMTDPFSTYSPNCVVVVPEGFTFDPNNITMSYQKLGETTFTAIPSSKIHYEQTERGNSELLLGSTGKTKVYRFWAEDFGYSPYDLENGTYVSGRAILRVETTIQSEESAEPRDFAVRDFFFSIGRSSFEDKVIRRSAGDHSSYLVDDRWDLDLDGTLTTKLYSASPAGLKVNMSENKNLVISGYLTDPEKNTPVDRYDPGDDGSNDENSVTFMTGGTADYHITIRNTNTNLSAPEGDSVSAYIPIPRTGTGYESLNTAGSSAGALGSKGKFQFMPYNWPMTLTGPVNTTNAPNAAKYTITYWMSDVELATIGPDAGKPVSGTSCSASQVTNWADVALIEISSDGVPLTPSGGAGDEFVLTLKVDISADDATEYDKNGTKNIFHPWMYRKSENGEGFTRGNWVAAKLTIAKLGGLVFDDADGDGIYDTTKGDEARKGVKVYLLKKTDSSEVAQTETDIRGNYEFENLQNGDYVVKFENPESDVTKLHFSPTKAYTKNNYRVNSDAVESADFTYATVDITLPLEATDILGRQMYLNAGLVTPKTVTIANSAPSKGNVAIEGTTETTITVWPGETVNVTYSAFTNYEFDCFRIGDEVFSSGDAITDSCTITGYWKHNVVFEKGTDGESITGTASYKVSDGSKLSSVPTAKPKDGKKFIGWDNGSGVYDNDAVKNIAITADTTFTAKFVDDGVSVVIFNFGGGENADQEGFIVLTGKPGEAVSVPNVSSITKTGWTAGDWLDEENNPVTPSTTFGVAGKTVTYVLDWTANPNTVKFAVSPATAGRVTAPTKNLTVDSGNTVNVKPKVTANTGYEFTGYWVSSEGGLFTPAEVKNYIITGENGTVTFTAQFKEIAKTAIIYDYNGGKSGSDTFKKWEGTAGTTFGETLPVPVRAGYKLTAPAAPNKYPVSGATVITATWTPISYAVKFNANGASNTMANQTHTYGTALSLTPNTLVKENYEMLGWATSQADATALKVTYTDQAVVKDLTETDGAVINLYAVWKRIEIKSGIYYDYDGGNIPGGNTNPSIANVGDTVDLTAPEKAGFTFAGWSSEEVTVSNSSFKMPANDVYLKALWTAKTVEVEFKAGTGGTTNTAKVTGLETGKKVGVAPVATPNPGYSFAYWEGKPEGGIQLTGTDVSNYIVSGVNPKITFTAVFRENQNTTIIYDFAGGFEGTKTSMKYEGRAGAVFNVTDANLPKPVRDGYTFNKWDTAKPANFPASGSTVIKAVWDENTYTVKFDKNSGTGTMGNMSFKYTDEKALDENKFTRSGYTFVGWSTVRTATSPTYGDKAIVKALTKVNKGEVTLYAIWSANTVTVMFDANGGSFAGKSVVVATGAVDSALVTPAQPTRAGYTYNGYDVTPPAKMPVANATYTVQWTENKYTVKFDKNGGEGTMGDMSFTYSEEKALNACKFSKPGHKFIGWAESQVLANAKVVAYPDGTKVSKLSETNNSVVTLYAVWDAEASTVIIDANGGKFGTDNTVIRSGYVDQTLTGPDSNPVRKGYTFTKYDPSIPAKFPVGPVTTYKAQWKEHSYVIIFDGNGATSGNMGVMELNYSDVDTLDENEFVRDGYDFLGWSEDENAKEPTYLNKAKISGLSDEDNGEVTLYAIWSPKTVTVQFNANGGLYAEDNTAVVVVTGKVDSALTIPEDPEMEGYTFAGYDVTPPETMPTADAVYTAVWEEHSYDVTVDPDGGKDGYAGAEGVLFTEEITLEAPSKEGYTFVKWQASGDNTGEYIAGQTVSKLTEKDGGEVVLKAIWSADTYAITYDYAGAETVSSNPVSAKTDEEVKLAKPERKGYVFKGWKADPATVAVDADGKFSMPASDVKLTAEWTPVENTVKFEAADGGETNEAEVKVLSGNSVGVAPVATAKPGYTFLGFWQCSEGGHYTAEEIKNYVISGENEEVSFIALFRENGKTTIIYDFNGGNLSGAFFAQWTGTAEAEFTETLPTPVRKGYVLKAPAAPSAFPTEEIGSETITAEWLKVTYVITDDKGNKIEPESELEDPKVADVFEDKNGNIYEITEIGTPDSDTGVCPVKVAKVSYNCTEGENAEWILGSTGTLDITFKRSVNDAKTFGLFEGIKVNGTDVSIIDYDAASGSVKISLKDNYLNNLPAGDHTMEVQFKDGKATAMFVVKKAQSVDPKPDDSGKSGGNKGNESPKTGDTTNIALWAGIAATFSVAAVVAILLKKKREERN